MLVSQKACMAQSHLLWTWGPFTVGRWCVILFLFWGLLMRTFSRHLVGTMGNIINLIQLSTGCINWNRHLLWLMESRHQCIYWWGMGARSVNRQTRRHQLTEGITARNMEAINYKIHIGSQTDQRIPRMHQLLYRKPWVAALIPGIKWSKPVWSTGIHKPLGFSSGIESCNRVAVSSTGIE